MKKILKWFSVNRVSLSGYLALILYFLDSVFNIAEKLCLADGWYYSLISIFFVLISISIKGNGIKGLKYINDLINKEDKIKKEMIVRIEELEDFLSKDIEDDLTDDT